MNERLERLRERPLWVVFAVVVLLYSAYQFSTGQTASALFGVAVAVVMVLSVAFQPQRPDR